VRNIVKPCVFSDVVTMVLFNFQPIPEHFPKPLHDVVNLIMVKNPDDRPRFVILCSSYGCY